MQRRQCCCVGVASMHLGVASMHIFYCPYHCHPLMPRKCALTPHLGSRKFSTALTIAIENVHWCHSYAVLLPFPSKACHPLMPLLCAWLNSWSINLVMCSSLPVAPSCSIIRWNMKPVHCHHTECRSILLIQILIFPFCLCNPVLSCFVWWTC